jgi:Fuc2NAc and GlcNAc transferase
MLGAWLVSNFGHRLQLTDVPNDRSAHSRPTQRGGGVGIVLSLIMAVLSCGNALGFDASMLALSIGGGLVSAVGMLDDIRSVPVLYRFAFHAAAACLVVAVAPHNWSIPFLFHWELSGVLGGFIAAVGIVWMINLFNFMDGIDGIAGAEAVFVAGTGAALTFVASPDNPLVLELGLVAAASAGFLVLNWPPARVFMGDVGSGFLGFVLGALIFLASVEHLVPIWSWIILTSVFLIDATITLLRRALRGERLYAAHSMHAYQHLSRRWLSHRKVTLLTIGINLLWLLPCAVASTLWPAWGAFICVIAILPVIAVVWTTGAGLPS